MSYTVDRQLDFVAELSNGTLHDNVTVVNVPALVGHCNHRRHLHGDLRNVTWSGEYALLLRLQAYYHTVGMQFQKAAESYVCVEGRDAELDAAVSDVKSRKWKIF